MLCCCMHAALLSVHEQTRIDVEQALYRSINMCYASELKKVSREKIVNAR